MRYLAGICLLLLSVSVFAQPIPQNSGQGPAGVPSPTFRADANLVSVRFQFTPRKGSAAADLRPEDIELREDGVARKVAVLRGGPLNSEPQPVEIDILFDDLRPASGGSVGPSWMRSKEFDLKALDDHERVSLAIWGAGERLVRLSAPTRDSVALRKALDGLWQLWAGTSPTERGSPVSVLPDLIQLIAGGRTGVDRMLVILAHGVYTLAGTNWAADAVRAARGASVAIFPVEVRDLIYQGPAYPVHLGAPVIYDDVSGLLAEGTGGRRLRVEYMPPGDPFDKIWKLLGDEIKLHDYVAGFYVDSRTGDMWPHRVKVTLKDPNRGKITGGAQTVMH
jgi:hypothetical protein